MPNSMTVKELKALLAQLPEEALVVLARDAEGNGFSPVGGSTAAARYVPASRPWQMGTLYTPGDPLFEARQGRPAVVLWPVH